MSQMESLKEIAREYKESHNFMVIDLSSANFPLSRDFFLVLTRRLPNDTYSLIVSDEATAVIARSLGIQIEVI